MEMLQTSPIHKHIHNDHRHVANIVTNEYFWKKTRIILFCFAVEALSRR